MHNATYDSRFFVEFFYSKNEIVHRKLEEEKKRKEKYVSAIVIHEVYKLSLAREGRETARLRASLMKKDFKVVPVDDQIAQISAELRQKYGLSMGDSMIAATASILKAVCISDDTHFKQIKEIETKWI
jgi:predicted nucleic acid-binding protein